MDLLAALNPFSSEKHILHTRLTPEECRARLQARTLTFYLPRTWAVRQASRPVSGHVTRLGFGIDKRSWFVQNAFKTQASGKFVAMPNGTLVPVRLGIGLVSRAFMALWLAFLAFASIVAVLIGAGLVPGRVYGNLATFLSYSLGMLGFALGLIAFSRWLSRNDGPFLLGLLRETLVAEDAGPGRENPHQGQSLT